MTELTQVRILMLEIRSRIDQHVTINDSIVKSLCLHLKTRKYDTIKLIHGDEFMRALIQLYEESELYEECAEMIRQTKAIIGS